MEWFVEDYNNRPHTVHKIFSPNEVYAGTDTYNYQSVLKTGMSNRRKVNSQCACTKHLWRRKLVLPFGRNPIDQTRTIIWYVWQDL